MEAFIVKRQPLSHNRFKGVRRETYRNDLQNSYRAFYSTVTKRSNDLYGLVYYFFNKSAGLDADNLSKPVWDCLTGFVYNDDDQIKFRTAGSYDLTSGDFNLLDLTGLSGKLVVELTDAIINEDHVLYIEFGAFKPSMIKFNIE